MKKWITRVVCCFSKSKRMKHAWSLFHAGKRREAITCAQPLLDAEAYCYEANFLVGISKYKTKQYTDSVSYLKRCIELYNYRSDHYNLAMAYVQLDKIDDAINAFKCITKGKEQTAYQNSASYAEMLLQFSQLLYNKDRKEEAFGFINELAPFYIGLKKTESHFLQHRGMPIFSMFLKVALPVAQAASNDAARWCKLLMQSVDQEGRDLCERAMSEFGIDKS